MSDQKFAEVEEIREVAGAIGNLAAYAGEAAAYGLEADPDTYMWGIVGAPFAFIYFQGAEEIHGMLQRLPDAVQGLAKRLDECAAAIEDGDGESASEFDKLDPGNAQPEGAGEARGEGDG